MPVLTKAQTKRLALRSIQRLERDIQPGIRRVSRAWRRLRAGLAEDVLALEPVLDRVPKAFRGQTATLAGAMQLAYLRGLNHVLTVARPHLPAQLALYDSAVANMEARLGMDAAGRAALALQTSEKAAKVLTLTGTALETSLRDTLITIQQRELTLGQAKREMRRAIADTGLGPEKNYQLEAIFRTQTQISYNAGRWDALQDEAIQDVLWGYEYSTVGDDRVRDSHAELNGVRAPKDDPIWTSIWPPNGWNCVVGNALIECLDGRKAAQDVRVGDWVLTHRGRFRPVLQVHESEHPVHVYAVNLDGLEFTATAEHQVATAGGWRKVSALQPGDELMHFSVTAGDNEPSRNVEHEINQAALQHLLMAFEGHPVTAADFDSNPQGWQVKIDPERWDAEAKMPGVNPGGGKQAAEMMFGSSWRGLGVNVQRRVLGILAALGFRHFLANLGPSERSIGAEFFAGFFDTFGLQPVSNAQSITSIEWLHAMRFHDAVERTKADAGYFSDFFQRYHTALVFGQEAADATRPAAINLSFGPLTIGQAAIRLLSHASPFYGLDCHLTVDAKLVAIKSLPKKKTGKRKVFTFSVGGDASYVADGIVSHNCRCTTIEIFEPEPVKAAPEGWQPDKGFTFDPRGVFELPAA